MSLIERVVNIMLRGNPKAAMFEQLEEMSDSLAKLKNISDKEQQEMQRLCGHLTPWQNWPEELVKQQSEGIQTQYAETKKYDNLYQIALYQYNECVEYMQGICESVEEERNAWQQERQKRIVFLCSLRRLLITMVGAFFVIGYFEIPLVFLLQSAVIVWWIKRK